MVLLSQKKLRIQLKIKFKQKLYPPQIILKDELNKIGFLKPTINFHSEVQASISIKIDKIQSKNNFLHRG